MAYAGSPTLLLLLLALQIGVIQGVFFWQKQLQGHNNNSTYTHQQQYTYLSSIIILSNTIIIISNSIIIISSSITIISNSITIISNSIHILSNNITIIPVASPSYPTVSQLYILVLPSYPTVSPLFLLVSPSYITV